MTKRSKGLSQLTRAPSDGLRLILLFPLFAVIAALLLYPLAFLLRQSVAETSGFDLQSYKELFCDSYARAALIHSLLLSSLVAVASTLMCLPSAWLFAHNLFPAQRIVRAIFTLPMSFSGIIVGFLTVIMLGRIGVIPQLAQKLFGYDYLSGSAYRLHGLVIAYLYFEIPRATLTLESAFRKFDERLTLAARSLGANSWQRFAYVLLPLIWFPLLSTFAVTFSASLGSFGVALIVARRFSLLPLEIYQQIIGYGNPRLMSAMAITLVIIAFLVNYSAGLVGDRRRRVI